MSEVDDELNMILEVAKSAVSLSEKFGADETDVYISKDITTSIEIENNSVNFSEQSTDFGIGLRVLKNGKLGFSYCTGEHEVEQTLKKALEYSKFSRKIKYHLPPAIDSSKIPKIDGLFDKKVLDLKAQSGLEMAAVLMGSSLEVHKDIHISGGGLGFGYDVSAIVNSNGLEVGYSSTGFAASLSTVIQTDSEDDVSGQGFEAKSSRGYDIDIEKIGRAASELAIKSLKPEEIEGGEMPVVFHPFALSSLIEFTVLPSLYGEAVHKGESVYSNKLGEAVAHENLTLIDDPTVSSSVGSSPIDDEGLVSRKNVLIEKGSLKGFIYDLATAAEYEKEPTGNGLRAERWDTATNYQALPDTCARNIYLELKTSSLDNLISDIKEGIYVYSVMGAHTANMVSGDFSVNSPTLFRIKNGEIGEPCKPIMISGNMPELMRKIVGMADDLRMVDGEFHPTTLNIGSIRIEDVKVTN